MPRRHRARRRCSLVTASVVVLVALPGTASAQRDRFLEALLPFYQSLAGVEQLRDPSGDAEVIQ